MGHALVLASLALAASAPAFAQPSRDAALRTFLQERFAEDRATYPDTRYAAGWVDLNADGRPEALVYMMSGNFCGSGGCTLFIYTPEQGSFYQHGAMSVTSLPVSALDSSTSGWRDLSVTVVGGGERERRVLLRYGELGYPDNSTGVPHGSPRQVPPGQMVIAADDRGRPLF